MGAREWWLLAVLMVAYLATRFWKIEHFPIYFFCDEAIQPVLGRDLVLHHFRNPEGIFLPTYFLNLRNWNLSLSIYIHALTASLLGMSVTVTRGTSIVVGALAPAATALTLRRIFGARLWWTAPLVMATLPAWFLHSRTAFETVMATAFYACFLLAYLLYRMESPRWLPRRSSPGRPRPTPTPTARASWPSPAWRCRWPTTGITSAWPGSTAV
jgi:hypothetical protein